MVAQIQFPLLLASQEATLLHQAQDIRCLTLCLGLGDRWKHHPESRFPESGEFPGERLYLLLKLMSSQ